MVLIGYAQLGDGFTNLGNLAESSKAVTSGFFGKVAGIAKTSDLLNFGKVAEFEQIEPAT